jgi:site-specific DNA-adenine methylase
MTHQLKYRKNLPGLKLTAPQISDFIPNSLIYVEPFAGMGSVSKYVKSPIKILNDKSEYSNNQCKKKIPDAIIENMDFKDTIKKYDSKDTFFLIDPPWDNYEYRVNEKAYCDQTAQSYYNSLYEILPKLKGDWILCANMTRKKQFKNYIPFVLSTIRSKRARVFNGYAQTLLGSNKPIKKRDNYQSTLD